MEKKPFERGATDGAGAAGVTRRAAAVSEDHAAGAGVAAGGADVRIVQRGTFAGGIKKYLLEAADGLRFECVVRAGAGAGAGNARGLFAGHGRLGAQGRPDATVSFSSQAGCPVGCPFCATGVQGWRRDLTVDEIAAQVETVVRDCGAAPAVLEASAQGEPLLNLDAVLGAFGLLRGTFPEVGLCVSTCGAVPGIDELTWRAAGEPRTAGDAAACSGSLGCLKVTLHTAFQQVRDVLMPGAACWDLDGLAAALRRFAAAGATDGAMAEAAGEPRIELLWGLLPGVNDSAADAGRAAELFGDLGDAAAVRVCALDVDAGQPWVEQARAAARAARGEIPALDAPAFAAALCACGLDATVLPPDPRAPLSMKYYRRSQP